jgi:DNA-binding GntR family transcriptional regulator
MCITMAVDGGEVRELNAAAGILEALAIGRGCFDAEAIAELRAANERLAAADGALAYAVADHDLHRRLSEPSGDEELLRVLASVRRSLHRVRSAAAPEPGEVQRTFAEHEAIIDAIERGEAQTAAQAMRRHVAAELEGLLRRAR